MEGRLSCSLPPAGDLRCGLLHARGVDDVAVVHRAAVMRADATEVAAAMAARGVGPGADGAYVDVHEAGGGVVADAALVEGERGIADLYGGGAGDADVDGVAEDVLRVLGDATAAGGAKDLIGFLSAVAADDIDESVRAMKANQDVMQQIELARVVGDDVVGVVVAQEKVEQRDGVGLVVVSDAVDDVDVFEGMQIVKAQAIGLGGVGGGYDGYGRGEGGAEVGVVGLGGWALRGGVVIGRLRVAPLVFGLG